MTNSSTRKVIAMRSILFPEKVGFEKGECCNFATDYYCTGCGRCEYEFDLRTSEECQIDEVAEKISYLTDIEMEEATDSKNADALVDVIVCLISLKLQLDKMLTAYNRGGLCNE